MNPIRAWNRFLFGLVSARPLGLFRIVFGLLMMAYLANMVLEFNLWYTGAGLLQGTEAREAAGPFRISPLQFVTDCARAKSCSLRERGVVIGRDFLAPVAWRQLRARRGTGLRSPARVDRWRTGRRVRRRRRSPPPRQHRPR